jgi:hypothetical protein
MEQKPNQDIYDLVKSISIKPIKICLWHVASELKMRDSNFSRMLRYPLSEEKRSRVLAAIEKLTVERGAK